MLQKELGWYLFPVSRKKFETKRHLKKYLPKRLFHIDGLNGSLIGCLRESTNQTIDMKKLLIEKYYFSSIKQF